MTKKRQSTLELRASTLVLAAGFALSALPFAAQAAGLGRVTVFSALGQPLRAEVELSATREELASMRASLASPESFKAAGLDYPPALAGLRFVIDRRASGEPVIRLESDRPINDPFVDMLLELNWASGRLVREYTFLLDPPELAAKAAASVAAPAASLPAPAAAEAVAPPRPAVPEKAPPAAAEPAATHEVKRGDTLRKIAAANQHAGVSLEQMLVGLYRANREAFDGNNMNRLQSGRILTVPERAAVESISEGEARREVAVQAADWNAYRRRLAAAAAQAPAGGDVAGQASAGRITPKVEEKSAPAAAARDQVRVSKTEAGEDALLARDKALKEANERLAVLERNVNELQKLLEMKNQSLAEMQKQAGGPAVAEVAPAPATAPQAAVKPAEAGPAEAPKVAEKKAEDAKPGEPPKAAEARPAPPKPKVVPPPPPEEPGLVETLLDDPKLPAAAGGILALLLAYIVARRRRTAAEAAPAANTSGFTQTSLSENSVFRNTGGQSVDTSQTPPQTDFSQAGPGTIDTDEVDPVAEADVYMAYGRDAQAEEILLEAKAKDPGRHAIHLKLLEIYAGRQNTAQFEALATELYGDTGGAGADWEKAAAMGRKLDPKNPLYGGDASPAKAADAGDAAPVLAASALAAAALAPDLAVQTDAAAEPEPPAAAAGFDEPAADDVPAGLDFDLGPVAAPEPVEAPPAADFAAPEAEPADAPQALADVDSALDFDLDTTGPAPAAEEEIGDLAFDLPEIRIEPAPAAPPVDALGAGFDEETPAEPAAGETPAAPPADEGLDFDFDLATAPETPTEPPTPPFDMRSISLDLDEPLTPDEPEIDPEATVVDFDATVVDFKLPPEPAADLPAAELEPEIAEPAPLDLPAFDADFPEPASLPEIGPIDDLVPEPEALAPSADLAEPPLDLAEGSEEAATKLDLAKAYEEMGDLEGARELLQEVIQEGSAEQRATAQASLERIGS